MVRKFFSCFFKHLQGLEKICPLQQILKPWLFFPFRQANKKSQYAWLTSLFLYKPDRIKSFPILPRTYFPETSTFERLSFSWTLHRNVSHASLFFVRFGRVPHWWFRYLQPWVCPLVSSFSLGTKSSAQAEFKVARRGSKNSINEGSGSKVNKAFPFIPLGHPVLRPLDSDWITPPALLGVQLAGGRSWGLFGLHNPVNQFISFNAYAYR